MNKKVNVNKAEEKEKIYVCPKCKMDLTDGSCNRCGFSQHYVKGLPCFLTNSQISEKYQEISVYYDRLYADVNNPWEEIAQRGKQFNQFIASIVDKVRPNRYLDVGCGAGQLIKVVPCTEKYGIDLSKESLLFASKQIDAHFCQGIVEELPYPNSFFDCISSIGVMTHFVDDIKATKEINRVLCGGGTYIVGIFVRPGIIDEVISKILRLQEKEKNIYKFCTWFYRVFQKKFLRPKNKKEKEPYKQPVERIYKVPELEKIFTQCNFAIKKLITKRLFPNAPLAGPHFRVYILEKTDPI